MRHHYREYGFTTTPIVRSAVREMLWSYHPLMLTAGYGTYIGVFSKKRGAPLFVICLRCLRPTGTPSTACRSCGWNPDQPIPLPILELV